MIFGSYSVLAHTARAGKESSETHLIYSLTKVASLDLKGSHRISKNRYKETDTNRERAFGLWPRGPQGHFLHPIFETSFKNKA